jgi:hypothetical protein
MAVDVSKQAFEALAAVIQKILGSREEAAEYAADPKGYLAAEGVADYDLAGVDLYQCVQYAASAPGVPAAAKQAVQNSYGGGSNPGTATPPPAAPAPGVPAGDHLVQHLNYVTQVSYKGDEYITQQLINYEHHDYSSHTNLKGVFHGDVDASTVVATHGGVASTGYGDVVAATGDGAVAAGRDAEGVATGDGAVAAGRDIEGAVNTGEFTGVQAGGDVKDSNINVGSGDQYNVQNSDVNQSAFGGGDVKTSEVNINANDGSAVAYGDGSKAQGSQDDNSTYIRAKDSNVQTGDGTQHVDQSKYIDKSVNDSYNTEVEINDSFNKEIEINDSFNKDVDIDVSVNAPNQAPDYDYPPA